MVDVRTIPALKRKIDKARRHMNWPRLGASYGPFLVWTGAFVIAVLFGGLEPLPAAWKAGLLIVVMFGAAALLIFGVLRYRGTPERDAVRALDARSEYRPLQSLEDHPVRTGPDGQTLWTVHSRRLLWIAKKLRLPSTRAAWNRADPLRLRYLLPLALIGAVVHAGPSALSRMNAAVKPDFGALVGADEVKVDAWLTPPDYTGRAPVFLTSEVDTIAVPEGTELVVRAVSRGEPSLKLDQPGGSSSQVMEKMPDGAWEARVNLSENTEFSVDWWGKRGGWNVIVRPDRDPTARFVKAPVPGSNDQTEFTWIVSDDYGVDRLFLELMWAGEDGDAPETERIEVQMNALSPTSANSDTQIDLTRHRWAGLVLDVRLVSIDAAGQEGYSKAVAFKLPEKLFLQPLARAAQEVRTDVLRERDAYPEAVVTASLGDDAANVEAANRLLIAPDGVQLAALKLDALTHRPKTYFRDMTVFVGLRQAHAVLTTAATMDEARATEGLLWNVALRAEYGSVADAEQALLNARRALEKALREGASEEEIRRLTEAFREAAENYLAAKMAEAIRNGGEPGQSPEGMDGELGDMGSGLGARDIEDMLNALSDLAETGAADQARQLLSDITNLLESLEFQSGGGSGGEDGFPMPGEPGEGEEGEQVPEQEQALRGMQERLSELLREQRQLNDDTLQSGQRDPFSDPGEGMGADELAQRQERLGELMDGLEEEIGRLGEEPGNEGLADSLSDQLGEARRLQERAANALERGDFGRAQEFQQGATEGLRGLTETIAGELDRLRGEDVDDADETDPFGNPIGGTDDTNSVQIPDAAERQRARDILDEIRRRFGETDDEIERDYLERLLDRF